MKKSTGIVWLAVVLMVFLGCRKEKSFEAGNNPSAGSLQAEASGDCLPKSVNGTYVAEDPLVPATNTLTVTVNVTAIGSYEVYTDTVNGYFFRAIGIFIKVGEQQVTLRSNGTPFSDGINNFVVNYAGTVCDIAVPVLPKGTKPAVYALESSGGNCSSAVVGGSYATGNPLNFTNTVQVNVNVATIGTYDISASKNGMTFSSKGTFTSTGIKTITLTGIGTPTVNGDNIIPLVAGAPTTTSCNFTVPVGNPAVGTLGGAGGPCTGTTVGGTYTVGVAPGAGNSVDITVNVTTPGVFSITTNTVDGLSFAASGNFPTATTTTVTLNATGTPTAAGVKTFNVTFGTSTCSFTVPVNGLPGQAVFAINCAGAAVNGTYQAGTALGASNTITIPVTVTTAGSYNISSTLTNGMVFSGSGSLTLASTNIILTGGGTPATATTSNIPIPTSPACTVPVTVNAASGGVASYAPDCSAPTIRGLYEATTQLNVSNVIDVNVNVTVAGTYNFSIPAVNGMSFTASGSFPATGPATIRLVGTGTPLNGGSFPVNVPGTTACSFQLVVDPAPVVDWKFTVTNPAPTMVYQGQTDDAELQSQGGVLVFGIGGSNSDGSDEFIMGFTDLNTINAGETYSTSAGAAFSYAPVTVNGVPNTDPYVASPSTAGVSVTFTVTSHNTVTKTITGTFTGTAKNTAGQTITITGGTFRGTYQ